MMHVDRGSGLLCGARQVESPNCDERPAGAEPELIVIHGISLPPGQYGGPWIDALFTNTLDPDAHPYFAGIHQLRVSAHLLIRRDGEVVQYVPFHRRAWHAGVSHYAGCERCNDFSVGIELEGSDDEPYEPVQYVRLADIITALERAYPHLSRERLVGHSDIAPGRKSDPGPAFLWQILHSRLSSSGDEKNTA
jgi:AmpD protein